MNPEILSEIGGVKNVSDKVRIFLKWLVRFEEENLERDRFPFKDKISIKINECLKSEDKE